MNVSLNEKILHRVLQGSIGDILVLLHIMRKDLYLKICSLYVYMFLTEGFGRRYIWLYKVAAVLVYKYLVIQESILYA